MTVTYLDTSAAMKLLVDEYESEALVDDLASDPNRNLVASWLLHTELHCAAGRHPDGLSTDSIAQVLDTVTLIDITRGDLITAGTLTGLRSNDAVHLATAIRLGADEIVTYDAELVKVATEAGITARSPSPPNSNPAPDGHQGSRHANPTTSPDS